MNPTFTAIKRGNAVEAVQAQLLAYLASGEVRVGDRLPPENTLADSLGVSRPVIREALGMLRALGLVVSKNGRGTYIAALSPSVGASFALPGGYSSDELHEVRRHLEIPGAGLAAQRRTDRDVQLLRENLDSQRECDDAGESVRLDLLFHALLAEAARNPLHSRLIATLQDLSEEQSSRILSIPGRTARSLVEHNDIFEAVASSDEARAMDAMETHLRVARTEAAVFNEFDPEQTKRLQEESPSDA